MSPLSAACEFARTYRRHLPDFICEQTTTSTGLWSTTVSKQEVTFEKGHDVYSNLIVNGKPAEANSSAAPGGTPFMSSGELGSDLVHLFEPLVAEFQFRKEAKFRKISSSVYEFHVAAEKNTFWVLHDNHGVALFPECEGELWLERPNGRLLRLELRSVHLRQDFGIATVEVKIDYAGVPIGDLGVFLLPSRSRTKVCYRDQGSCAKNVLVFDNCRKFAAKSRILVDHPRSP